MELFGRRKSLLETERAAGQLRRQAYEDPLTHLPNRRYAEARLDGLLSAGAAPALAVVDVDRFKSINDAIGHPGGDSSCARSPSCSSPASATPTRCAAGPATST